jgi:hypothetical protein
LALREIFLCMHFSCWRQVECCAPNLSPEGRRR